MEARTTIYFVRHGEVHNPRQIYYGRLPGFHLSETGRQQAKAAASYLCPVPLSALFSSPQARALETAEIIRDHHPQLRIEISEQLDEVYTRYDGQPYTVLEPLNFDFYSNSTQPYEQPCDILLRTRAFCEMVSRQYAGQQVAAITHGDVIAFMILWARGAPLDPQQRHALSRLGLADDYPAPASITALTFVSLIDDAAPECTYIRPY